MQTALRSRRKINTQPSSTRNQHNVSVIDISGISNEDSYSDDEYDDPVVDGISDASASEEEEEDYVVEKIIKHRDTKKAGREYYVKWLGWPSDQNTWEPREHLTNCEDLLNVYERNLQQKQTSKRASKKKAKTKTTPKTAENKNKKSKTTVAAVVVVGEAEESKADDNECERQEGERGGGGSDVDGEAEQAELSPQVLSRKQKTHKQQVSEPEQPLHMSAIVIEDEDVDSDEDEKEDKKSKTKSKPRQYVSKTRNCKQQTQTKKRLQPKDTDVDTDSEQQKQGENAQNDNDKENDKNGELSSEEDWDTEATYVVEEIRKHRKSLKKAYPKFNADGSRCYEYLVKWKDWAESTNTWEHETGLAKCQPIIDAYWNAVRAKQEKSKSKNSKSKDQDKDKGDKKKKSTATTTAKATKTKTKSKSTTGARKTQSKPKSPAPAQPEQAPVEPQAQASPSAPPLQPPRQEICGTNENGNRKLKNAPQSVLQKKKALRIRKHLRASRVIIPEADDDDDENDSEQEQLPSELVVEPGQSTTSPLAMAMLPDVVMLHGDEDGDDDEEAEHQQPEGTPHGHGHHSQRKRALQQESTELFDAYEPSMEPPVKRRKLTAQALHSQMQHKLRNVQLILEHEGMNLMLDALHGKKGDANQQSVVHLVQKLKQWKST